MFGAVRAPLWARPRPERFEEAMREEDVPAEQSQASQDPRVSDPDAHSRRPGRDSSAARQGPHQPLGLIWRVRDPATFRALARGRRRRSGALEVSAVPVGARTEPPRVAYAVGRSVGNAVVRNRVRRRMRAAMREHQALLEPGWGYLVRVGASAAETPYRDLSTALRAVLESR
jgi:ribonuclease P protein component